MTVPSTVLSTCQHAASRLTKELCLQARIEQFYWLRQNTHAVADEEKVQRPLSGTWDLSC
jgi:hypothetical protein